MTEIQQQLLALRGKRVRITIEGRRRIGTLSGADVSWYLDHDRPIAPITAITKLELRRAHGTYGAGRYTIEWEGTS